MNVSDLISANGEKVSEMLTTTSISSDSTCVFYNLYSEPSEITGFGRLTPKNREVGNIDERFISMAEASSKEIGEQIDKGDAVRKKTLSIENYTRQRKSESCQNNSINEDNSIDVNEVENTELSEQIRKELSDISARLSSLSSNPAVPIWYQSDDNNVSHEIGFQQSTPLSDRTIAPQDSFSEVISNKQQNLFVYNKTDLTSDTSNHLKYSISRLFNDDQFKVNYRHKTLNKENLDSLRKLKRYPTAGKNSIANKKYTKTIFPNKSWIKVPQNLLISAAQGLQELFHDSSDDESLDDHSLLKFDIQNSTQNLSDSSSSTESSKHTYTMESPSEYLDRKFDLEQMEGSYHSAISNNSVSNSGSRIHETADYSTSNGTFTRPRLPHSVVPNADLYLKTNSNNCGSTKEKNSSHHPLKMNDLLSLEELDDYLFDTQKLVTQLEQKMANDKSEKAISQKQLTVKQNEMICSAEDYEVAKALSNADQLLGSTVNKRLSAILQRRQDRQKAYTSGLEQAKKMLNGFNGIPEEKINRSRRTAQSVVASRPQSQQPTSRCTKNSHVPPCDQPSVPLRNASETRRNHFKLSHNSSNFPITVEKSAKSFFSQKTVNIDRYGISHNHSSISSTPESSRHLGVDAIKTSKMLAALNWQRRKSYDPKQFLNKSSGNSTARSQSRPPRDDDIMSISTDSNPKSCITSHSVHPKHKLTVTTRRTAPVDTADCIAAMEIVKQIKLNNTSKGVADYCNRKTDHCVNDSNRKRLTGQHNPEFGEIESKLITSGGKSNTSESRSKTKQISKNNSVFDGSKHSIRHQNSNENKTANKQFQSVVTARLPTHQQRPNGHTTVRIPSQSCTREWNYVDQSNSPKVISTESTDKNKTANQNEVNYPDIAVESVKFKIEKLTNFIVRLRKRIERDYAEHGTCSPGDDVFGDEAVGAVVAGRPTGMHPVVATCLQNLRILEVNAQEIFSLLYPNEVDFWEPARVCLLEGKDDDKLFNDARSQITEHLSSSIEASGKPIENTGTVQCKISSPLDCLSDKPEITKELDTLGDADLI
ncbi:unnamed protein product [Schistosoma mattheei]|uniref:Uncharacterized protein n=1 Tax=Schistosoma mattheei TaxID=31246 RepID=A0AA85B7G7_9TREM|nr:unnamed protein product [Schistosoma mattheei]